MWVRERKKITLRDLFVLWDEVQKNAPVAQTPECINERTSTGTRLDHHIISSVYGEVIF
jgi:hypothetical protein